jgi:hypothetical protein
MTDRSSNDHGDEFIAMHGSSFVKADDLVQEGKLEEAVRTFTDLLAMPSNAYVKAVMWINIAVIKDKMGQTDEALRAYDEAGLLERSYNGYLAREHKALYLARTGRTSESLLVLEELLRRTDLKNVDRERIAANVKTLRKK